VPVHFAEVSLDVREEILMLLHHVSICIDNEPCHLCLRVFNHLEYFLYFFWLQSGNLFQLLGITEEFRDLDDQLSSHFGLHDRDDSSTLREIVGDPLMSTRAEILILGLAVSLFQGCAQLQITGLDSATPQENRADNPLAKPRLSVDHESMAVALGPQLDVQEEHLLEPAPLGFGSTIDSEAEPKSDPQESRKSTGSVPNQSSVSRSVSGARADDRFLSSLERDLNKATEQPVERRRLEFSREVIENPRVRYFINQFSKSGRNDLEKTLVRSGKYVPMITQVPDPSR
jgi:hypothetical protein